MREDQLRKMERELTDALTGEMPLSATADFATRSLGVTLAEIRRLQRENAQLRAAVQKAA